MEARRVSCSVELSRLAASGVDVVLDGDLTVDEADAERGGLALDDLRAVVQRVVFEGEVSGGRRAHGAAHLAQWDRGLRQPLVLRHGELAPEARRWEHLAVVAHTEEDDDLLANRELWARAHCQAVVADGASRHVDSEISRRWQAVRLVDVRGGDPDPRDDRDWTVAAARLQALDSAKHDQIGLVGELIDVRAGHQSAGTGRVRGAFRADGSAVVELLAGGVMAGGARRGRRKQPQRRRASPLPPAVGCARYDSRPFMSVPYGWMAAQWRGYERSVKTR